MRSKAERTDMSYWGQSLPSRLYNRMIMTVAAFLWTAIFTGALGLPFIVQCLLCGGAALLALLFRQLKPNGFSGVINSMTAASDQARAELADGNFSEVPDFIQNSFPYPTSEEFETARGEKDDDKDAN